MTLMPHSWFFILFSILFAKHLWCHCTKDHCIVEWIAGTAVLHVGEKNRILEATGRTDCCGDITKKWKKNNKERGLSWRLLNYVTLVTSQDPDVSLEQAAVWMDWSFIDSDTGSGWVLSQQRLGTLELGPERPVGTLPWCQNSEGGGGGTTKYEYCTLKDWRPAEGWKIWNVIFGVEEEWSRNLSSLVRSSPFCAVTC